MLALEKNRHRRPNLDDQFFNKPQPDGILAAPLITNHEFRLVMFSCCWSKDNTAAAMPPPK